MVVSFIGIFVFIGIAIFNNINISYEAYNYIYSTHNRTDFKSLQNNIYNNVKTTYNGSADDYAGFINGAITELNNGIDFYLDYLAKEDELSKGEQDKLCSLYDKYLNAFTATEKAYNQYKLIYEEIKIKIEEDHNNADYGEANLRARDVELVREYSNCYKNGSAFFKYLVEVVENHCFNGERYHTYNGLEYMIEVGLVDNAIPHVLSDMTIKLNNNTFDKKVRNYDCVDSFYDFLQTKSKYSQKDTLKNNVLLAFVNNLNSLNVYEWAGNYNEYSQNVPSSLKEKCESAKSFYDSNFRGIE